MTELLDQERNGKQSDGDPKDTSQKDVHSRNLEEVTPPKERKTLSNHFLEDIMKFQMLKNFVLPTTLKPYEGLEDPHIYVTKFQSMTFFNGASDPILCRSFSTFLDGAALLWGRFLMA
ncbi:uncharacterized protein DS421_19g649910 [Arachis hypogaea]|uniref:Retrotransposon gag domain-containing protein n=1 Tax=Arachis hypogaea TaxID=3818 RepID=A0A6B9VA80_ARAHY|nr:uncharacterized protein DS421_19g649910 [Arachis hypogaea]